MSIFLSIALIFFWSAVLSFVPSVIYLIINPLKSIISERLRVKGIYLIKAELELNGEEKKRTGGICVIYSVCLAFIICLSMFNWIHGGEAAVVPIDILSTMHVVLFSFAALTYVPIVLYIVFRDSWRYKDEGVYLRKAFLGYGVCIVIFSAAYAYHWLKNKGIPIGLGDLFSSIFICIIAAASLSYLPVLGYILIKARKPRIMGIRPGIIFVIFAVNFLLFSSLYIQEWISDRRAGVERIPFSFYLKSK